MNKFCNYPGPCPHQAPESKFQNCRAEALYEIARSPSSWCERHVVEETGAVHFEGKFYQLKFISETTFRFHQGVPIAIIPAGHYVLHLRTSGQVRQVSFDSEREARDWFDRERRAYENWAGTEE